jgi:hypothetical protein
MSTFIVFIISLILIIFLFSMKSFEIYSGRKIFLEDLFLRCDSLIQRILFRIKHWWSHVNFRNLRLIFSWIIVSMSKLIIAIKRRFDHKQSTFFTKKDHFVSKKKGPVSFFLKDVSDYKKSLREGKKNK